jgi:hypothetical protein
MVWRVSRHSLTIILLAVLFLSLTISPIIQKKTEEPITINLRKTPKKKKIYLSEIANSIQYIPLETRHDLPISYCSVTCAGSGFLVCMDNTPLYLFDDKGAFVSKIANIGQGPGEYVDGNLNGFNEETSSIYVMDQFKQEILKYDMKGRIIESFKLKHKSSDFCLMGHDKFMLYASNTEFGDQKYGPHIMQGNEVLKWDTPPSHLADKQAIRYSSHRFQQVDESVYLCNTRYSKEVKAYNDEGDSWIFATVNSGQLQIPDHAYLTLESYHLEHRDYIHNVNLFATPGYIFVNYVLDGEFKTALYNRQTGDIFTVFSEEILSMAEKEYNTQGILNDIDGGPALAYQYSIHKGKAIMVLQPIDLLDYYDDDKLKETSGAFAELMADLDINDNPVIMVVDLGFDLGE